MEYALCEGQSANDLAKKVNAMLAQGWRLYGSPAVFSIGAGSWWYYQAVVRGGDAGPDGSE